MSGAPKAGEPRDVARDERFMDLALAEARRSMGWDDVPIGAVVVRDDEVIGAAGNERERTQDPTAHAEILALRRAAERVGRWHLEGCTVYVTIEPCAMCAGAIVLARADHVVFGAADPKAGFAGSLGNLLQDPRLNHRLDVTGGVLSDRSADLVREFFTGRRAGRVVGP